MTEGVAQVQQRALAGFLFVLGDDGGLGGARGFDRSRDQTLIALDQIGAVAFQPGEEVRPVDQAVLDHLGVAGQQLALGQGAQGIAVGQHQARLMEGADQVLAVTGIDAGLTADRGVDLGQKRGWDLNEVDPAQQHGGGEAGQIADHPAAKRDQHARAFNAEREYILQEFFESAEGLARLAGRQNQGVVRDAGVAQRPLERLQVQRRDVAVRDDHGLAPAEQRARQFASPAQKSRADQNIVTARAEIDAQRSGVLAHPAFFLTSRAPAWSRASNTLPSVTSGGPSSLSTTRLASA